MGDPDAATFGGRDMIRLLGSRAPKPTRLRPSDLPDLSKPALIDLSEVQEGHALVGVSRNDLARLVRLTASNLGHLKKSIKTRGVYELVFDRRLSKDTLLSSEACRLQSPPATRGPWR